MIAELEASECSLHLYYLDACDKTKTILMELPTGLDRPSYSKKRISAGPTGRAAKTINQYQNMSSHLLNSISNPSRQWIGVGLFVVGSWAARVFNLEQSRRLLRQRCFAHGFIRGLQFVSRLTRLYLGLLLTLCFLVSDSFPIHFLAYGQFRLWFGPILRQPRP
jgi:hypothetical protein